MENKCNTVIYVDCTNKSIRLGQDGELNKYIVGPYLAMYFYRYRGFTWDNWKFSGKPSLQLIQKLTREYDWEEYVYSIIVKEGTTLEEMYDIVETVGYIPDYFLEVNKGKVNLLHQTSRIDELINLGYDLTDYKHGEGNYSFGKGVYCLDADIFDTQFITTGWIKDSNVYRGEYDGEYLRCVGDTRNGLKCGYLNKYQQELIIPFNESEIKWIIK